jgi:diaminohydroxyphosphoribosylaminopyrimidine deaminase/5-amino-6-(5-phosphoribosylamino)uracil reductase
MSQHDELWMQRALDLARATTALASPNPQVGCVLIRDGQLLGEGAHLYDQRDHAEIAALKQAAALGHDVAGATAYVTLEPCSHQGRTGPCADALIAARIARCVVATVDPNPQVSGRGIARLQAAGIAITVGVLQPQARALNDAFAYAIQHRRPYVTLKSALSVDGQLAPPPSQRPTQEPHWLTGPESRAHVQTLRHASDAILTGIGTVLADDPALTDRTGLPRRRPLLRVVLDTHLRTPLDSQLVRTATNDLLLLCGEDAPNIAAFEARGVQVLPLPAANGRLPLPAVLDALADRQILSLLLEAGALVNGAFLSANLVQRAVLFYAETELGPGAVPFAQTPHGPENPFLLEQRLHHVTHTTFGTDACVTGTLYDPWPAQ